MLLSEAKPLSDLDIASPDGLYRFCGRLIEFFCDDGEFPKRANRLHCCTDGFPSGTSPLRARSGQLLDENVVLRQRHVALRKRTVELRQRYHGIATSSRGIATTRGGIAITSRGIATTVPSYCDIITWYCDNDAVVLRHHHVVLRQRSDRLRRLTDRFPLPTGPLRRISSTRTGGTLQPRPLLRRHRRLLGMHRPDH